MSEQKDCPYCPGTLTHVEDYGAIHECSNGDCPAGFVAVLNA